MSVRSLNKVLLIGNLTRDPELRYTPSGTAVCSFGIATNRSWTTEAGEKKEETEFHRVVSWNKLAELCSQLLTKGRKIYVEGRLQTRTWQAQDGTQRTSTEIVIDDMIILDSRRVEGDAGGFRPTAGGMTQTVMPAKNTSGATMTTALPNDQTGKTSVSQAASDTTLEPSTKKPVGNEDVNPDDIPF
ncbi:MAG: single-stranded DNA-binding protein [Patescibacteria group bacterium]